MNTAFYALIYDVIFLALLIAAAVVGLYVALLIIGPPGGRD